jgi:hypothetical protein
MQFKFGGAIVRFWLLAGSISVASAADPATNLPAPKRITVPKLNASIKVDGNLKESVWKKAAVLTPFLRNDGSGAGKDATELLVWYDDQSLYLGWKCSDHDIQATFTKRDSKFWEEEVAELFITPGNLNRYFELQWNPLGGVFDAIISNVLDAKGMSSRFDGDWDYTAKGMISAVRRKGVVGDTAKKDTYWHVEVRVPFSDFGTAPPKPGDVWRGNFYRFNRGKGHAAEPLSWSPTLTPSFHQPNRFGFLEFGEAK